MPRKGDPGKETRALKAMRTMGYNTSSANISEQAVWLKEMAAAIQKEYMGFRSRKVR